jgi:hypothetical protein
MIAADGGDVAVHQQARCLPRPAHAGSAIAKADDVDDPAPGDIIQSRFQRGEIAMDIGNHRKAHGLASWFCGGRVAWQGAALKGRRMRHSIWATERRKARCFQSLYQTLDQAQEGPARSGAIGLCCF